MAEVVRITDVSPRDGLQNEAGIIPTSEKIELVRLLCETGVDEVEVSSFVSPKWVPQLGDAETVFFGLLRFKKSPVFSALVPNERGMQAALEVNHRAQFRQISKVSVFTAASETFSRRNTNASIAETLERFKPVIAAAREAGLLVRAYISCAIACPFEGPIQPAAVAQVAVALANLGVDEIDLGDTIGAATDTTTRAVLSEVLDRLTLRWLKPDKLTLHLHDTFGRAAECVKAALDHGIRSFDGSVAGLGGCPYASTPGKRAPGNISTELLVRTVEAAGFKTGVNMQQLSIAADYARRIVAASRKSGEA